ncbi:MAG: InlB B-repeat-containing protein [Bacilli bacterium]|nr:InlB B-repeat-containing protein [Bacilli bacterium]
MFKRISLFIITFILIFTVVGCTMGPSTQNKDEKYTVTFECEFECEIESVQVKKGELVEQPETNEHEGYIFLGWYNGKVLWDFEKDTVTKNITLTAKWEEHTHEFVEGECECGEKDPNYVPPHEHVFVEGECECGEKDPNYVPPHEHVFVEGECECGEKDPNYVPPHEHIFVEGECECGEKDPNWNAPVVGDPFTITYQLNGGAWSWTTGSVSAPAKGIDSISNLPEIFMADFYTYLYENNLLNSSKVSTKLQVATWDAFSTPNGDPVALYNATSTGGYGAADGYSELFFDSVNGYEAVGGFLGTSPYKEKYANVTKHIIQLTTARYSMATTSASFKGACGFVLDGYFYGTQGLLATDKANAETFNALRAVIPTPTVGYVGSTSSTNSYQISTGKVGTLVKLVAPVKEGYMFLGWYESPDFSGNEIDSVSKETTLYAKWYDLSSPAPKYNINYELDGGTNPSTAPKQYTFGQGAELVEPTKDGYMFMGWTTDAEGENLITSISKFAEGEVTVYANWVEIDKNLYTITYIYSDGKLPTYNPTTIQEVAEYVFTEYYKWYKPSDDYETFKSKVIAQWKDKQAQGIYKFYKQNGKDTIDESYFCNASENFEEWNAWFTVFDSLVTKANGAQNAWNSYVGILRLGQVLSGNAPTTWKADFNTTLCNATNIAIPLVTEYRLGQEVELVELVIDDGRTFLGWYDEFGNKVEKITSTTEGNLVLTARWSEAVPVDSFSITNPIDRLLKLSDYQLTYSIGPSNATFKKVTFESTNPSVLKVSEKGLLEAVSCGTAKILITVHGNQDLNMELEIEVYVDPFIRGEFMENSYVVAGESVQLGATLVGANTTNLVWKSNTPSIATVSQTGLVTGVNEGLAEIVVYCVDNDNIAFTFYVTVFDSEPTGILKLLADSNNSEIYTKKDLLIGIKIGSDGAYYSDIIGSVSKLLFEDYVVHDDYYLANPSNKSTLNGDGKGGIDFITVHYAADMPYAPSATFNGGKNLASYNQSCNSSGTQASWHYSVGNDGIWSCQNESYGAWHAGASKKMTWVDSGLTIHDVGSDLYTTDVTMGTDGYFYIKGVKTNIKNTSGGTKLNGLGLGVKVEGNTVYLGGHYQNTSYNYISSTGGNNNSIGMETSVREGSDLWLTWQYTAQLCAKLLIKYELPLNRLVGHHFFSGKWCPQPMLENDLEIWYEFVELTRQQMELYQNYSNYQLSFTSNSQYLDDNGRVKELPDYTQCVTYTITYSDGVTTKTVTFSSILPGNLE